MVRTALCSLFLVLCLFSGKAARAEKNRLDINLRSIEVPKGIDIPNLIVEVWVNLKWVDSHLVMIPGYPVDIPGWVSAHYQGALTTLRLGKADGGTIVEVKPTSAKIRALDDSSQSNDTLSFNIAVFYDESDVKPLNDRSRFKQAWSIRKTVFVKDLEIGKEHNFIYQMPDNLLVHAGWGRPAPDAPDRKE